jgi:hypothetical protein
MLALNTGLRDAEIKTLTWGQLDLQKRYLAVSRSKTEAGEGRTIPLNSSIYNALAAYVDWYILRFGELRPVEERSCSASGSWRRPRESCVEKNGKHMAATGFLLGAIATEPMKAPVEVVRLWRRFLLLACCSREVSHQCERVTELPPAGIGCTRWTASKSTKGLIRTRLWTTWKLPLRRLVWARLRERRSLSKGRTR